MGTSNAESLIEQDGIYIFYFDYSQYTFLRIRVDPVNVKVVGGQWRIG